MKTLKDLLLHELAGIFDAEQQLARALPMIEKAVTAERLQRIVHRHAGETTEHVAKLKAVFSHLAVPPVARTCAAMTGLIEDAVVVASAFKGSPALDAALIGAVQKIENYEIAVYGCLREWAELLGNEPATALLQFILEEEKTANEALTQLARARCNGAANVATAEDESSGTAGVAKSVVR
jgi:ferritin-like metal-binding protein YciE